MQIKIDEIRKYFGDVKANDGISFTLEPGSVYGLLGENGAGKSTTMRILCGLIPATSGTARICGIPVATQPAAVKRLIGYLPENNPLPEDMRVLEYLVYRGQLKEIPRRRLRRRLVEVMEVCDLGRKTRRRVIRGLSKGFRQRVGLADALLADPEVVILDEPTSGIDPLIRRIVIEILREFAARGGTVIYSSHNLSEVEQISSRAAILRQGKIVALKTIEEVRAERGRQLEFVFGQGSQTPESLPEALHQFEVTKINARTWRVCFHGSPSPLLRWLTQFDIVELSAPQITLEEAFMTYYRGDAGSSPPQSAAGSEGRN